MKAIVVGMGKLGYEIAAQLVAGGYDTVVIDQAEERLAPVTEQLDVLPLAGNGAAPRLLQQAGAGDAALFVAVSGSDEVNMVACLMAKRLGAALTVARLRNLEYFDLNDDVFSNPLFGIDVAINPDYLAALELMRLLKVPHALHVDFFCRGRVSLISLPVFEQAPLTAGPLRAIDTKGQLITAVVRDDSVIIPHGDTRLLPNDHAYFIGRTGSFGDLQALVGSPRTAIRDVVVVGGGSIGSPLVQMLAARKQYRVKVFEKRADRCERLAQAFPDVLVIHGDAERLELLEEEQVGQADVMVITTSADHTNMLTAMAAKQLGVREIITIVSREDYVPLAERAGADATVVPRLITAGHVLKLLHRPHVVSMSLLAQGKVVVLELIAEAGAAAAGQSLRALDLPPDAVIGCIAREDQFVIPDGDTTIEAGDHIIAFTLPQRVKHVEALFRDPATAGAKLERWLRRRATSRQRGADGGT